MERRITAGSERHRARLFESSVFLIVKKSIAMKEKKCSKQAVQLEQAGIELKGKYIMQQNGKRKWMIKQRIIKELSRE